MSKAAIHNPSEGEDGQPGRVAHFSWGGAPYEIQPGETQLLDEHLVAHARKHNPWLKLMDESMGKKSFAESQVRLAEEDVARKSEILAQNTADLKKAQATLNAARLRLKAEEAEASESSPQPPHSRAEKAGKEPAK